MPRIFSSSGLTTPTCPSGPSTNGISSKCLPKFPSQGTNSLLTPCVSRPHWPWRTEGIGLHVPNFTFVMPAAKY